MTGKLDASLLSGIAPFRDLSKAEIREVLSQARSRRLEPDSTVFEESRPAGSFFLLLDGFVRVVRITPDGEQVVALHIPPGQLFGIARALGRDTYPATAIAATEILVLEWPMRLWTEFTQSYAGFASGVQKTVGLRVGEMNDRLVEMATRHVEQRVANALLRLVNQTGKRVETGIEIGLPITRQDISEMTGTTLHTVSRLLSQWGRDGIVKSTRKRIVVTDPHRLVILLEAEDPPLPPA